MRKKIKAEKPMRVEVVGLGPWEKRIMGFLIALLGLTFLGLGLHTGQLQLALKLVVRALKSALTGLG